MGAEHPGDRDPASGAGWINVDAAGMDSVAFATLLPFWSVRTSSKSHCLRLPSPPGLPPSVGTSMGSGRNSRSRGKPGSHPRKRAAKKKNAPSRVQPASVRQRLRWIPPGRFLMGSPDDEEGRDSDEGPRHEVTIGSGFWMFDTPCTQSLWEALMGKNPSEYQSRDRPVESVSWKDCQEFLRRLNAKVGLSLSLPSESQWEYACRAGTIEATYAGPLEIKGSQQRADP